MVPSGTPSGSGPSVPPSLLRSNSGILGGQGAALPSQSPFSSLVPSLNHYNNVNLLGNMANMSPLLNQSFGNGIPTPRGNMDAGAEPDPLSNGLGFNVQSSFMTSTLPNAAQSQSQQQFHSNPNPQMLPDQTQPQIDPRNFHQSNQHFSSQNPQHLQQQQFPSIRSVKMEPQTSTDHSLRILGQVKLEPQHMRTLPPVKMESPQSDQSLFLHQHQQQQQFLQMSRQSSQATAAQLNMLTQQKLLQLQQQQQQQQLMKSMPQQRAQMPQQQSVPLRSNMKPYEPGMCARRLTHYMFQQQHRPEDNNIEYWRKFVAEYFAPHAKKKLCVSMYGTGRQTTGVFPQDVWYCEICNRKPGRGFEATAEVLPRLFKIKHESGTIEELLYVDMPREYQNNSGQIVLDYAKAIQESVFEQLRVVREGQLRIVFSPELKICSWEFCARRHEELIPRRLLLPQVSQVSAAAQKYTQNASSNLSLQELQNNCNLFVASSRQLAKALEVPLVNDLGYTKRYVRCLQIYEVVNSMKDLIDYSRETGTGPMESLIKFPRRTSPQLFNPQSQAAEEKQASLQEQLAGNMNHLGSAASSTSTSTIVGLLHQNSRQQNSGNSYAGNPSPASSTTIPHRPNMSPFQSPSNPAQTLPSASTNSPASAAEADLADSQSSVQKLIHDMLLSNQMNEMKNVNVNGVGVFGVNGMRGMNNGRMGMGREPGQHDLANQLLSGLGPISGFNNLQFDWKQSP